MSKFTKEELEVEIKEEQKAIEEEAFKLYCKDEISAMLQKIEKVDKAKADITKEYEDRDIDKLRVEFNTRKSVEVFESIKNIYIKQVMGSKNNS